MDFTHVQKHWRQLNLSRFVDLRINRPAFRPWLRFHFNQARIPQRLSGGMSRESSWEPIGLDSIR
jgi:hypothetical protein